MNKETPIKIIGNDGTTIIIDSLGDIFRDTTETLT